MASIVLPGPTGRAAGPGRRGCWRRAAGRLGVRAGGVRAPPLAGCVRAPPLAGCVGAPPLAGCWDNLAAVGVGAALLGRARPCFGRVRPPPLVCVNIVCLNIRIATSSRKKLMKLILGLFRSSLTARLYPVSTAPRGVPPPLTLNTPPALIPPDREPTYLQKQILYFRRFLKARGAPTHSPAALASFFLYARMSPFHTPTPPSSHTQIEGHAGIVHHVTGRRLTQEARLPSACDAMASNICHALNKRGFKVHWVTWRATSATPSGNEGSKCVGCRGEQCPPRPTQISRATWSMSRKSCDTSTRPPLYLLSAVARESMASMSRWLVGSSSS